jgi:hypothetical protein
MYDIIVDSLRQSAFGLLYQRMEKYAPREEEGNSPVAGEKT